MQQINRHRYLIFFPYLFMLATLLWSCGKKESNAPRYYIKYNANGAGVTFDQAPFATQIQEGEYGLSALGLHSAPDATITPLFTLALLTPTPISSPGVFRASESVSSSINTGRIHMAWKENHTPTGLTYVVAGPQEIIEAIEQVTGIRQQLTLTISAIDGKTVRGTFEGVAQGTRGQKDDYFPVNITGGEFYVPLMAAPGK